MNATTATPSDSQLGKHVLEDAEERIPKRYRRTTLKELDEAVEAQSRRCAEGETTAVAEQYRMMMLEHRSNIAKRFQISAERMHKFWYLAELVLRGFADAASKIMQPLMGMLTHGLCRGCFQSEASYVLRSVPPYPQPCATIMYITGRPITAGDLLPPMCPLCLDRFKAVQIYVYGFRSLFRPHSVIYSTLLPHISLGPLLILRSYLFTN